MLNTEPAVQLLKSLLNQRPELQCAMLTDQQGIVLLQEPVSGGTPHDPKLALLGVDAFKKQNCATGLTLETHRIYTTQASEYFVVLVGPADLPWGLFVTS